MKIITFLILTMLTLPDRAETKWGETRLGFEITPISSVGYTAPLTILSSNKKL